MAMRGVERAGSRIISSRPFQGREEDREREVRISCPDATGLGCDIARLLLDFGLRIMEGMCLPPCLSTPPLRVHSSSQHPSLHMYLVRVLL